MLYSFNLIKRFLPFQNVHKDKIVEALNLHTAETSKVNNNSFELDLPANRYSDLGSHLGIIKEIGAVLKLNTKKIQTPKFEKEEYKVKEKYVEVQEKELCPRYLALCFENIKVEPSPKWLKQILNDCGLNSINNVVDIINYTMLLTGQPLHAFDRDKISQKLIIRRAKKGERIVTLDEEEYDLDENVLVIADNKEPLVIAGIKGGKKAEVSKNTKRIIVESASFKRDLIYKTSRKIGLATDASLRFSHQLSYFLPEIGISWAKKLLEEMINAKPTEFVDQSFVRLSKKIIGFSCSQGNKFEKLIGFRLSAAEIKSILRSLGFVIKPGLKPGHLIVQVPLERVDIDNEQDLSEELLRIYGLRKIGPLPPKVLLKLSQTEEMVVFKEKIRDFLVGLCFDEVYNYSFVPENAQYLGQFDKNNLIELENPISSQYKYLRPNLTYGLMSNLQENLKNYAQIKIFEIGKVFSKQTTDNKQQVGESWHLGLAMVDNEDPILKLKGIVDSFLKAMGLVDFFFTQQGIIESNFKPIGCLYKKDNSISQLKDCNWAIGEIDLQKLLQLITYEKSFKPLPLFPSVMRDLSVFIPETQPTGEIIRTIQETNLKYIEDVDLIDEFYVEGKRSLTFRIVFQAKDRTLTSNEVNKFMEKIEKELYKKFAVKIRK